LCEKWRGTQKEKGRICKALLGGSIPFRASTFHTPIPTEAEIFRERVPL
jgi:hypothetical protein